MDADITCISETHLSNQNTLNVDGLIWLGFNRSEIHRSAPKASGGVGIFIKESLAQIYSVTIVDKSHDGILGVKFCHKTVDYNVVIYVLYLPPERSNRDRDAQSFFSHILSEIYINYESDAIFVIGDLNSRIGAMPDTSSDFDGIPSRKTLDKTINQHGQEFCEFLIDAKMCVLNGRFDPTSNCYTSVSGRGRAVVDYICVPHDVFPSCKSFTVIPSNSLVEKHKLQNLLGNRSKVPDHSFICTEFDTGVASVIRP